MKPDSNVATLSDLTEPELLGLFESVANAVKVLLPPGSRFLVLAFDDSNIGQYVSNAHRCDMIKVLRETADRLESRDDVPR